MRNLIVTSVLTLLTVQAQAADLGLNASSLKLKVYKFAVSTSPLCTNLQTIVDNGTSPSEVEFVGSVNIGSGSISSGTYPCVVVEFSDNIKYTPSANSTSGNCLSSVENTMDVCRNPDTSRLIDGSTTNCTSGADRVAMYISTASTSTTGSDAFNPPTSTSDSSHGFNLASALSVSGSASGKFVVNPSGKVCDGDDGGCDGGGNTGQCRMEPPSFSFTGL